MHQSTETHRTIKELSPAERAASRVRLDTHFRGRQVDEALLHRAWQTAYRVASMLYEDFGATRVAVFGSLAEREWFSSYSDIDIAVWGLSDRAYLKAAYDVYYLSSEFKVDLVDFDSCKGRFRERIQSQIIGIEKGEIYHVDLHSLIQRISDERAKIGNTVQKINARLQKIVTAPPEYREETEIAIAKNLADCYQGIENIFKRIALDVDVDMPQGERWHTQLLEQMAAPKAERPPVISKRTFARLQELLEFRFVYIYAEELDYARTLENAQLASDVFDSVSEELQRFIAWLENVELRRAQPTDGACCSDSFYRDKANQNHLVSGYLG